MQKLEISKVEVAPQFRSCQMSIAQMEARDTLESNDMLMRSMLALRRYVALLPKEVKITSKIHAMQSESASLNDGLEEISS